MASERQNYLLIRSADRTGGYHTNSQVPQPRRDTWHLPYVPQSCWFILIPAELLKNNLYTDLTTNLVFHLVHYLF